MRNLAFVLLLGGCSMSNVGDQMSAQSTYQCTECQQKKTADTSAPRPVCHNKSMIPEASMPAAYACAKCGKEKTVTVSDPAPNCWACKTPMTKK